MSASDRSPNAARPTRLAAAVCTFAIWALLAASVLWWLLRAGGSAAPAAPVAGRAAADVDSAAVARALGAGAAPAQAPAAARADGRFALRGVLTHGKGGAALVAVGGKVRAVRVGAPVGKDAEGWTLHEAQPHAVVLAAGDGNQTRLEMPAPKRAASSGKARAASAPQPAPAAASTPAPARQRASRARARRAAPDAQTDAPQGDA